MICTLFGRRGKESTPWQSITYHVTSSIMREGCHFILTRDCDGCMFLSGYCFDEDIEYRVNAPKQLSQETVLAIETMALDKADSAMRKFIGMADGTQVTITLSFPNGKERKIPLHYEQREHLKKLLKKELIGK